MPSTLNHRNDTRHSVGLTLITFRKESHLLLALVLASIAVVHLALGIARAGGESVQLQAAMQVVATGSLGWDITGSLNTARSAHTATLLPEGKVLVAGGRSGDRTIVKSAELYDPATGTWSTTGSLNTARAAHTATLLPGGKVLVAGGFDFTDNSSPYAINSAELYDPTTGTWGSTGNLSGERVLHTATLLGSGKVLVVGGYCGINCSNGSAELYDPATGKWVFAGGLNTDRVEHMATRLDNGKVLVVGGLDFWTLDYTDSAELYDPVTGTWTVTGNLKVGRNGYGATLLSNGKVLIASGGPPGFDNTAELYDPVTGTWSLTGSLNTAGSFRLATLLPDREVLITGGTVGGSAGNRPALNSAELYDQATGTWTVAGSLNVAREDHTATLLRNGKVLVTGGVNGSGNVLNSAELYGSGNNLIDDPRFFVRQQYRDFLNREADQAGEDFWTDNITKCSDPARRPPGQTEAQCTLRQRETTSGAFFQSPEFQYTGYFVHRMFVGALGRQPKLSEFTPDAQFVGAGIIVNGQLSGAKINQNKADFAAQFVNCTDASKSRCAEFKAIYDGLNNQAYVDKLFQTTGINASAADRTALVSELQANPTTGRATVLQKVVDGINVISEGNQQFNTTYGEAFYNAELNRAFVLLQYFGYMKRDPDEAGYAFWLAKLNQFNGNFVAAEMVLAFISSPEYRARFGQP